jgi:hypothetical protein
MSAIIDSYMIRFLLLVFGCMVFEVVKEGNDSEG